MGSAYLALGHALRGRGALDQARAAFASAADQLRPTVGVDPPKTREAVRLAADQSSAAD